MFFNAKRQLRTRIRNAARAHNKGRVASYKKLDALWYFFDYMREKKDALFSEYSEECLFECCMEVLNTKEVVKHLNAVGCAYETMLADLMGSIHSKEQRVQEARGIKRSIDIANMQIADEANNFSPEEARWSLYSTPRG